MPWFLLLSGSPNFEEKGSTMYPLVLPILLVLLRLPPGTSSVLSVDAVGFNCPRACFCNILSKIVYCSRRGLLSIPPGIASDSLQLNVNANVFLSSTLRRSNFSGLADLGHLYMSECGIDDIEVGAFSDLSNLRWLDLSNNRLKVLRSLVFEGLNLQHLFLNGNRQLVLIGGSLEGLMTTGLYLHDCAMNEIRPEVLSPLNATLKYLWLNGNELTGLDAPLRGLLYTLIHLRLGSNPLHCNCELMWLKEFYDRNGDVFKGAASPSCFSPSRLKGKLFNQVTLFEFSCKVPAFTDIEVAFGLSGARLKCTAAGDPMPTLYWIQPSGKATKYNSRSDDDEKGRNEGVLTVNEVKDLESLRGMYICVAHNEAGNVTLTINVSWSDSNSPETSKESLIALNSPVLPTTSRTLTEDHPTRRLFLLDSPSTPHEAQIRIVNLGEDEEVTEVQVSRNRAAINTTGFPRRNQEEPERLFTVVELVCAVFGTHLSTMLLCLVAISRFYRCRVKPKSGAQEKLNPSNGFVISDDCRTKAPSQLPVQSVYINSNKQHIIVTDYSKAILNTDKSNGFNN